MKLIKTIVISLLVSMFLIVTIFAILQLKTGLDPSPYLGFLAPITAVALTLTALLSSVSKFLNKDQIKELEQND